MSSDDEWGLPKAVKTFITRFYRSIVKGHVFDVGEMYENGWRDISRSYYETSTWPTAAQIADIVDDDPIFLCLYNLLCQRHNLFTLSKREPDGVATIEQYLDAWISFENFFRMIVDDEAADLQLPSLWLYDTMSDFLDHFSKFHTKHRRQADEMRGDSLYAEADKAWRVNDVIRTFLDLVEFSDIQDLLASGRQPSSAVEQCAYFALINLCRLNTKFGDYAEALDVISNIDLRADGALLSRVAKCHVTLFYYVGYSLMMTRRYSEALSIFSSVLLNLQRTRTSLLSDPHSSGSMIKRRTEKMLALLSICVALCPGHSADDLVVRVLKEKHGDSITAMLAGDIEKFESVMKSARPEHLDPVDSETLAARHLAIFKREVESMVQTLPTIRSYLQLYTNIDIPKLARFTDSSVDSCRMSLVALKMQSLQRPLLSAAPAAAAAAAESADAGAGAGAGAGSSSDASSSALAGRSSSDSLRFFIERDVVHVDEQKRSSNTSPYLIRMIGVMQGIERRSRKDSGRK